MPFPVSHLVVQLLGTITSGGEAEIWSNTLRIAPKSGERAIVTDALQARDADAVLPDAVAWWETMRGGFPPTVRFTAVKANVVDVEGRYVSQGQTNVRDVPQANQPGTAGNPSLPSQVAIAVTFHTAKARGLSSKGRVYLPAPSSIVLTQDGRLAPPTAQAYADRYRAFLVALNNWPGVDAGSDPGVVSVLSKVREGARQQVTGVSVGNRFDVQRRRANRLGEQRSTIAAI